MCTAVRLDVHRDTQTVLPIRASTAKRQCGLPLPGDPSDTNQAGNAPWTNRKIAALQSKSEVCKSEL